MDWLGQPTVPNFPGTNTRVVGYFSLCISEITTTIILVFVWNLAMYHPKVPEGTYGFLVGGLYGCVTIALGRITGGCMNPARVFGPGLIAGDWEHYAFYILMPFIGAYCGNIVFKSFNKDDSRVAFDSNNFNLRVLKPVDVSVSAISEMSR